MRVLLTGGSGFIGTHLAPALQTEGHQVVVYDLYPPAGKVEYAARAVEDLSQQDLLNIDAVVHLAAQTDVAASMRNPRHTIRDNVDGTLALLETIRQMPQPYRPGRLVFLSTHSVYGAPDSVPIKESAPSRPIDPYGASKASMEKIVGTWSRAYGLWTTILRLSTVYGFGGKAAPNKMLSAASQGQPIIIEGTGEQTRDFVYVGDVVGAIVSALGNAPKGEVYNIGGGTEVSIKDLANTVVQVTGSKAGTVFKEGRGKSEAGRVFLDISRAKADLGFEPIWSTEKGLQETWKGMKG